MVQHNDDVTSLLKSAIFSSERRRAGIVYVAIACRFRTINGTQFHHGCPYNASSSTLSSSLVKKGAQTSNEISSYSCRSSGVISTPSDMNDANLEMERSMKNDFSSTSDILETNIQGILSACKQRYQVYHTNAINSAMTHPFMLTKAMFSTSHTNRSIAFPSNSA